MKTSKYNKQRKNICGKRIRELRIQQNLSQQQLSIKAQLAGHDFITETIITKLESGLRSVPDYEVVIFAELLHTTVGDLLDITKKK